MKNKYLKNIEWSILISCLILLLIGMVALYSATKETGNVELKKQIVWTAVSIPIMIIVMLVDYNTIAKISPVFYGIFIIGLIAVLFTEPVNGATSWFKINDWMTFQPSEFAKVIFIVFLAFIIQKLQNGDKREINKFWKLLITGIILAIPAGLIVLQPDYGTLMAFLFAYIFMMFIAGIDKKIIILALVTIVVAVPLAYTYVLPNHAKTRIDVFLNPTRNDFYDPFLMPDMEIAVNRIIKAIENQEKVIIYGDYDVDGITSITVLKKFLQDRGLNVDSYIPNRLDEGYGLNKNGS